MRLRAYLILTKKELKEGGGKCFLNVRLIDAKVTSRNDITKYFFK